jgi:hypothetical protein
MMRSRHVRPHVDTQEVAAGIQNKLPSLFDALALAQGRPSDARTVAQAEPTPGSIIQRIALNHLSFPRGNRRKISLESIQALAGRIHSSGQVLSLLVVRGEDSQYCVVAGERRFAALRLLAKQRRISPTFLVPCRVISARATAEADSPPEIASADRLEAAERRRRFIDLLNRCPELLTGSELAARKAYA